MKIRNWMIFGITSGMVLILQGCMLMHFVDDHHSGMMGGHGAKNDEGRGGKGHQTMTTSSMRMLDKDPRQDTQGGVTVTTEFRGLKEEELAFRVKMDLHSGELGQHRLNRRAILANDLGTEVPASRWEISSPTGHEVTGTLSFPAKDGSGRFLLSPGAHRATLKIKDLAGISEHKFHWNLASGH